MGVGFAAFEIIFVLAFVFIIGTMVVSAVSGISRWSKNNNSPRITANATVVSRRSNTTRHHHHGANGHHHHSYSNTYYVTFQFESGDRIELQMTGPEFGLLLEGDKGKLTFQGTRYLGFQRDGMEV